ncbi:MAG: FMN-binding protein [Erysipelotrichaceae bacterium]|nr:FMN-binding protein [Erysipelotrichaceae bacterium]
MKKTIYLAVFLGVMSAIFGGAIAFVNDLTAPLIAQQAMAAESAVFNELDPEATFSELDISEDQTGLIKKGYYGESSSNKYWIYSANVIGFNSGTPIDFLIGFNQDGDIILYNVINQQETDGIGSRVSTDEFEVVNLNVNDAITPLSGATVSSNAVISGINAAKTLYSNQAGVSVDTTVSEPEKPSLNLGDKVLINDDYTEFDAICEESDSTDEGNLVFKCNALGYGLIDPDNHSADMNFEYTKNEITIVVNPDDKSVVSITLDNFGDTANIGDKATTEEYFETFSGLIYDDEADTVTGASWTSKSIVSMVQAALAASE